jgi:hypothetical protein
MKYIQNSGRTALLFIPCLVSLLWLVSYTPAFAQEPLTEEEDARCLSCHSNPDLMVGFDDGTAKSAHINSSAYIISVHGRQGMTCRGCHPDHEEYPHPELSATSSREFTLTMNETCLECHPYQADEVQDSNHARALAAGHPESAVCVDCHGAHSTLELSKSRVQIATTCRKCHAGIFDQYNASIHGKALREEENTDVPTCVDCHGVHTMEDPTTTQFRLNSPNLCGSCHADEALMSKYNISTDVFDTYVADFHGSTVTLFEKQSPDAPTNKAVCYDCHGVHDIRAMDDPESIAASKENLLVTCQKCHPDATTNFPDSWTSHYQPTFDQQPLVATVNLFYLIVIPATLGFMGFFVVIDAGRKFRGGKKHDTDTPQSAEQTEAPEEPSATTTEPDSRPEERE